jgi:hypothetical protein
MGFISVYSKHLIVLCKCTRQTLHKMHKMPAALYRCGLLRQPHSPNDSSCLPSRFSTPVFSLFHQQSQNQLPFAQPFNVCHCQSCSRCASNPTSCMLIRILIDPFRALESYWTQDLSEALLSHKVDERWCAYSSGRPRVVHGAPLNTSFHGTHPSNTTRLAQSWENINIPSSLTRSEPSA